jgi:hypothetical protein
MFFEKILQNIRKLVENFYSAEFPEKFKFRVYLFTLMLESYSKILK